MQKTLSAIGWRRRRKWMKEGWPERRGWGHEDLTPEANPARSSRENSRVSSCAIGLWGKAPHFEYWELLKGPGGGVYGCGWKCMLNCKAAFGKQPEQLHSRWRIRRPSKSSFHSALGALRNSSMEAPKCSEKHILLGGGEGTPPKCPKDGRESYPWTKVIFNRLLSYPSLFQVFIP